MNILHISINPIALERRILNQVSTIDKGSGQVKIIALKSARLSPNTLKLDNKLIEIKTFFHRGGPLKFLIYNLKVWLKARRLAVSLIHAHAADPEARDGQLHRQGH